MTFEAGSTLEQRYPAGTRDAARASARDRIAAFEAAGWDVQDEGWLPDAGDDESQPADASVSDGRPGTLVVVFVARQLAEVPLTLRAQPIEEEPGWRLSGYMLRLVVGLVVFAVLLLVIMAVGLPVVGTLVGTGTPKPFGG